MIFNKPRLIVAALRGGSGKTVISVGLAAAWRLHYGMRVIPFKKGPDYIDAGWLSVAAQHPCYNLDPFLMNPDEMLASFIRRSSQGDLGIIEGNRGLYDGVDTKGSFSTAELSKFLRAPVLLVIDGTKTTRTAAALVLGCQRLDPEVEIKGVVLNQVAGKRHEQVLRGAIEQYCGIPVLGSLPKEKGNFFPERHLGLVPHQESERVTESLQNASDVIRQYLDVESIKKLAENAGALGWHPGSAGLPRSGGAGRETRIGVIRDSAFQFYYPENLEALEEQGATLVNISSFEDNPFPDVDALYIGGGFPETHLETLSSNSGFRNSVRDAIERGMPVYAECGGLMFLCRGISHHDSFYPMAGVFPFDIDLQKKPQGHGYTVLECVGENPYFPVGTRLKGHEFHYSRVVGCTESFPFVFKLEKGHGVVAGWDGLCYKNTLACYSHIHAVGNRGWASALTNAARAYRSEKSGECLNHNADPDSRVSGRCDRPTAS